MIWYLCLGLWLLVIVTWRSTPSPFALQRVLPSPRKINRMSRSSIWTTYHYFIWGHQQIIKETWRQHLGIMTLHCSALCCQVIGLWCGYYVLVIVCLDYHRRSNYCHCPLRSAMTSPSPRRIIWMFRFTIWTTIFNSISARWAPPSRRIYEYIMRDTSLQTHVQMHISCVHKPNTNSNVVAMCWQIILQGRHKFKYTCNIIFTKSYDVSQCWMCW